MQVAVIVEEKIKDGQQGAYLEHMREMIALTKAEDGCIAYDLYEDADGAGGIVMVELWESKEALDKHMQSEHFTRLVPAAAVYQEAPPNVRILSRL